MVGDLNRYWVGALPYQYKLFGNRSEQYSLEVPSSLCTCWCLRKETDKPVSYLLDSCPLWPGWSFLSKPLSCSLLFTYFSPLKVAIRKAFIQNVYTSTPVCIYQNNGPRKPICCTEIFSVVCNWCSLKHFDTCCNLTNKHRQTPYWYGDLL